VNDDENNSVKIRSRSGRRADAHAAARTIAQIAQRASVLAARWGVDYPVIEVAMDLHTVHEHSTPLRLEGLLEANVIDFAHDVFGIRWHLDRESRQLGGCFMPRYEVRP
jgi:hypothetical protein